MKKKELQELFALLDEAGVRYELCDTPEAKRRINVGKQFLTAFRSE